MSCGCAIQKCKKQNDNTANFTKDWGNVRYYCDEHWDLLRQFFMKVGAHACDGCIRNHHAETDSSYFRESTVKFCEKYWDLCGLHIRVYEDAIDYFNIQQLPED